MGHSTFHSQFGTTASKVCHFIQTIVRLWKVRGCIQKFPDWVIRKYMLTIVNTRWEATQRVMEAKLTRLNHKIAIKVLLVGKICTICSSRTWWPVRKLLDTPSYAWVTLSPSVIITNIIPNSAKPVKIKFVHDKVAHWAPYHECI
jgi:hypothetical protein